MQLLSYSGFREVYTFPPFISIVKEGVSLWITHNSGSFMDFEPATALDIRLSGTIGSLSQFHGWPMLQVEGRRKRVSPSNRQAFTVAVTASPPRNSPLCHRCSQKAFSLGAQHSIVFEYWCGIFPSSFKTEKRLLYLTLYDDFFFFFQSMIFSHCPPSPDPDPPSIITLHS